MEGPLFLGEIDVRAAVLELCAWVQRGEGPPERGGDVIWPVAGAICPVECISNDALFTFVHEAEPSFMPVPRPADEIKILLLAGLARNAIASNRGVRPREVAALADLTPHDIGRLVAEGELETDEWGSITPDSAARLVRTRQVPGF